MKYALVTHVPTFTGQSPGVLRLTEAFAADLLAQAAASREVGLSLALATPRHSEPDGKTLARERFVDIRLADHGIEGWPLPAFRTMRQFVAARGELTQAIAAVTATAAVVQLGAGGHPTALGQFAWPLIDPARHKRVFVFAGDPLPGRRRAVTSGRNPAKRLAKGLAVRAFDAFCRQAIGEADWVFAHDPAVARRYGRAWNDRCHTFVASPIGDGDLVARRSPVPAGGELSVVTEKSPLATGGTDHVETAVAKARRLGAKIGLTVANRLTADVLDAADVFVAAPLVPGEIPSIFAAAARGLPMVCYGGGMVDADLAAAGGAVRVERGDVDRLAQALIDLAADRSAVDRTGRAAQEWAAANTRDAVHRRRAALVRTLVES